MPRARSNDKFTDSDASAFHFEGDEDGGEDLSSINAALRDGNENQLEESQQKSLADLRESFRKLKPFKTPRMVARALNMGPEERGHFLGQIQESMHADTPLALKGFIATSKDGKIQSANIILDIKALYGLERQSSLLLDEGSTFRIIGVRRVGGRIHVHLEQTNKGPGGGKSGGFSSWLKGE